MLIHWDKILLASNRCLKVHKLHHVVNVITITINQHFVLTSEN